MRRHQDVGATKGIESPMRDIIEHTFDHTGSGQPFNPCNSPEPILSIRDSMSEGKRDIVYLGGRKILVEF
jgi:hypothetical protein